MKKYLLSFLILILCVTIGNGQTNVSGTISTNTTWTIGGSPFIVIDTVVVLPGITLTIQPGVTVKFATNKRIEIKQGSIIANGTSIDSIYFTSNSGAPAAGSWDAIFLNQAYMPLSFNYCNIQFATNGILNHNVSSNLNIRNCTIKNNINGLNCDWGGVIDSCVIKNNSVGLILELGTVTGCTVSNNQIGLNCSGTAIYNCIVDSNQIGFKDPTGLTLKKCAISYNQDGISSRIWDLTIDSCTISHNQNNGIVDTISNAGNYNSIKNSSIDSNSVVGIYFSGNQNSSVINCKIRNNSTGIIENGGTAPNLFTRNTIENNFIGIQLQTSLDNFYCNKICNNSIYDLKYAGANNATISNNFWCTSDSISTQALIFDGNDSISLGFVNFMPLDTFQCYLCNYIPISFATTNPSCSACSDGIATAYPANGTPPYSYSWNTSPIQTTQTATGLSNGYHIVCVTDSSGCIDCDSVFISYGLLVNELEDNFSISIFPNPFSNESTLKTDSDLKNATLTVYNTFGQEVKQIKNIEGKEIRLHRDNLPAGIYFIQLSQSDKVIATNKIIISD